MASVSIGLGTDADCMQTGFATAGEGKNQFVSIATLSSPTRHADRLRMHALTTTVTCLGSVLFFWCSCRFFYHFLDPREFTDCIRELQLQLASLRRTFRLRLESVQHFIHRLFDASTCTCTRTCTRTRTRTRTTSQCICRSGYGLCFTATTTTTTIVGIRRRRRR